MVYQSGLTVSDGSRTLSLNSTNADGTQRLRWRVVRGTTGLTLQWLEAGTWRNRSGWTALSTPMSFQNATRGTVRVAMPGGTQRDYRRVIRTVRTSTGAMSLNLLPLDEYLRSVVPSEMPASWPRAALEAQAVAARTIVIAVLANTATKTGLAASLGSPELRHVLLARNHQVIGASGAVLGVLMAFARFWPRERIFIWGIIPIEARWLVIIYAAIDILGFNGFGRAGVANVAHLGGFAGALLYLLFLERRQGARRFKQAATPKVPESVLGNWKSVDRESIHAVNREEVDRILDKISASGLASLTPQERQFLSNFVPPDDRKPA